MLPRRILLVPAVVAFLAGCAALFPKPAPIEIGDAKRFEILEVQGPADLVPVVREQLVREITERGFEVAAPGDLQIRVAIANWDYFESDEAYPIPEARGDYRGTYRACTATMALAFDVVEPANGNLLQHRDYLGVDVGKEGLPGAIRSETGLAYIRRAATKAAAKFVDDLTARRTGTKVAAH
jgi:hypothetical protein